MDNTIKNVQFELGNVSYEVSAKRLSWEDASRRKFSKAFVWPEIDVSEEENFMDDVAEMAGLQSRFTSKGEYPIMDKLWSKMNRKIVKHKRTILNAALEALEIKASKIAFSRYAGCSCPCSPGFNVKGLFENQPVDIYVSEVKN